MEKNTKLHTIDELIQRAIKEEAHDTPAKYELEPPRNMYSSNGALIEQHGSWARNYAQLLLTNETFLLLQRDWPKTNSYGIERLTRKKFTLRQILKRTGRWTKEHEAAVKGALARKAVEQQKSAAIYSAKRQRRLCEQALGELRHLQSPTIDAACALLRQAMEEATAQLTRLEDESNG